MSDAAARMRTFPASAAAMSPSMASSIATKGPISARVARLEQMDAHAQPLRPIPMAEGTRPNVGTRPNWTPLERLYGGTFSEEAQSWHAALEASHTGPVAQRLPRAELALPLQALPARKSVTPTHRSVSAVREEILRAAHDSQIDLCNLGSPPKKKPLDESLVPIAQIVERQAILSPPTPTPHPAPHTLVPGSNPSALKGFTPSELAGVHPAPLFFLLVERQAGLTLPPPHRTPLPIVSPICLTRLVSPICSLQCVTHSHVAPSIARHSPPHPPSSQFYENASLTRPFFCARITRLLVLFRRPFLTPPPLSPVLTALFQERLDPWPLSGMERDGGRHQGWDARRFHRRLLQSQQRHR